MRKRIVLKALTISFIMGEVLQFLYRIQFGRDKYYDLFMMLSTMIPVCTFGLHEGYTSAGNKGANPILVGVFTFYTPFTIGSLLHLWR